MEEEAKTLVIHCGCMTPQSKRLHDFSVRKPSAFKHVIIWVRVGLYPVPLTMPMKIGSRQEEEWEGHYTPGSLHDTPVHTSLKTFVVIPIQKLRLDLRMYYTSVAVVLCNETKYPLGPLLIQIKSRVHQKQHLYAGRKDKP